MGYCIYQKESKFAVKKNVNLENILTDIKNLYNIYNDNDLSWVEKSEVMEALTIEDIFEAWRWEIKRDDETKEVNGIAFAGEKFGDCEVLFETINKYVKSGSYIRMYGEDGERWTWKFTNKGFTVVQKW